MKEGPAEKPKNLEETYVEHELSKGDEDPTTAHYFEGTNPLKASVIKHAVSEANKQAEEEKIKNLREDILEKNTPEIIEKTKEVSQPIVEDKKTDETKPKHKSGFLRKLALTSMFGTLFASNTMHASNKNEIGHGTPEEDMARRKEMIEKVKFAPELTPEEIDARKKQIENYLSDSMDIKLRTPRSGTYEERDKDMKQYLDSLLKIKNRTPEVTEQINQAKDFTKAFAEMQKENKEYLKNRDSVRLQEILDLYQKYDQQKKWLRNKINSEEYLKRLTEEFKGDKDLAEMVQQERLNSLDKDYVLESPEQINEDAKGARAYFDTHVTHLPYDESDPSLVGVHEYQHQSTRGNSGISAYAQNLYRNAFDSSKTTEEIVAAGRTGVDYFGDPTELDARKKQLEKQMEKLGIKKYGEQFTEKHNKQLLQMMKKGLLDRDVLDFLHMIKPEYLTKIMNTIAVNENKDKNQENLS